MCRKAIVLVAADGRYREHFLGEPVDVEGGEGLDALEKKIAATGYYAWRCTLLDQEAEVAADAASQETLFLRLILERCEQWMALAEERLQPKGIPCYVNAGNDDPPGDRPGDRGVRLGADFSRDASSSFRTERRLRAAATRT